MENAVRNTLKKQERLSSEAGLSKLFSCGHYGTADFIRYCYLEGNGLAFNRIVVSVPKRNFKRAVKRNLLKRRIREAYRTAKTLLPASQENGGTDILFIYGTKELMDYRSVQNAVNSALTSISGKLTPAAVAETSGEAGLL